MNKYKPLPIQSQGIYFHLLQVKILVFHENFFSKIVPNILLLAKGCRFFVFLENFTRYIVNISRPAGLWYRRYAFMKNIATKGKKAQKF